MGSSSLSLLGVNLSGAEFGTVGQAYGVGYTYPTHSEVDYYASKGLNVIRLPFMWERLQPVLNGPLDTRETARLDDFVSYATSKGLKVILDAHNYGQYNGQLIGGTSVPNSSFADFWSKLSDHFRSNQNVMFGLMNEPLQGSATSWLTSVNSAISAIRSTGASQEVLVSGVNYDGAWTWTSSQNASVIGTGVRDPLSNYAFEVHQYLDSDGSGTHSNVVSSTIGVERIAAITSWADQNATRLFLGEFGVAGDATSTDAMKNMLTYMSQHANVWQGGTYWAGGPWWGNYMYSSEPTSSGDAAQLKALDEFAPNTVAPNVAITSAGGTTTQSRPVILGSGDAADAGSTVFVYDNGGASPIGSAVLGQDGTWSTPVTLSAGTNVLVAKDTNAVGTGVSNVVTFTLSVPPPNVAAPVFDTTAAGDVGQSSPLVMQQSQSPTTTSVPNDGAAGNSNAPSEAGTSTPVQVLPTVEIRSGVAFQNRNQGTIFGTVGDGLPGGLNNIDHVEVMSGVNDLGAATVNADGLWSLTTRFAPGPHANVTALAFDTLGSQSALALAPFTLATGVRNQPFSTAEHDFDPTTGLPTEDTYFERSGAIYLHDTIVTRPHGCTLVVNDTGDFFSNLMYSESTYLYAADGSLGVETLFNEDGTHTVTGFQDGQYLHAQGFDTMVGGGVNEKFIFNEGFGQDIVTGFIAAGSGHDVLSFAKATFGSVANVLSHATQNGIDTVITTPNSQNSVTLIGVSAAELQANPWAIHMHP